tara:strand:+ start:622 stop:978 length:357 start_codon:yes stop_codon:yes gene_type:complete
METVVKLKYIRQSAKKIRFVLNTIRGMQVNKALDMLDFSNKKAGKFISKGIRSGISNLTSNIEDGNLNENDLYVIEAFADEGPAMKRFRPAAMGRATPILKRSSHITLKLSTNKGKKE